MADEAYVISGTAHVAHFERLIGRAGHIHGMFNSVHNGFSDLMATPSGMIVLQQIEHACCQSIDDGLMWLPGWQEIPRVSGWYGGVHRQDARSAAWRPGFRARTGRRRWWPGRSGAATHPRPSR